MTRSPPLFICSSPGPDPYRSHDNVYEELEHRHHCQLQQGRAAIETDSERVHVSDDDDDFAEDELSLPGERSFQKSSPDTTTVATYHERSSSGSGTANGENGGSSSDAYIERNRTERNSLLSSSSSGNDNSVSGRPIRTSNSSSDCGVGSNSLGLSLFRCNRSSNNNKSRNKQPVLQVTTTAISVDNVMEPGTDIPPVIYDDHHSLIALPPSYSATTLNNNNHVNNNNESSNNSVNSPGGGLVHSHSNNNNSNSSSASNNQQLATTRFFSTPVDNDEVVERRNRINAQLSQHHPVATIFRERGGAPRQYAYHQPRAAVAARTNPRSLDRRRFVNPPPAYFDYRPADTLVYDYADHQRAPPTSMGPPPTSSCPYILPEFTTFRLPPNGQPTTVAPIYSRDSSFGSDSGYSQHTQNSGRSGWPSRPNRQKDQSLPPPPTSIANTTFEGS